MYSSTQHLRPSTYSFSYIVCRSTFSSFFFFNDTATTEIYTLSLHDALPIWPQEPLRLEQEQRRNGIVLPFQARTRLRLQGRDRPACRSEEHTSELQSHLNLVCRLLLEKKKN